IIQSASKSIFLDQQPYFIQRTGLVNYVYHLHSFEETTPPVEIDIAGISLSNCLKVLYKGNLILLRNDTVSKVERVSKNCIEVSDSGMNEKCSIFTGDDCDFVYISDGKTAFYVLNIAELQVKKVALNISFHIRCVRKGIAIIKLG
ncbi:hypothetical protein PENTCL1PPCAC_13421, partial [Pristionchus entomophagus]